MAKLQRETGLLNFLAIAWLAAAVLFSGIFIIEKHVHDCTGENCRICFEVQIAKYLVEAFGRLGLCLAAIGFFAVLSFIKKQLFFPSIKRLVELKVRFNC